MKRFRVMRRQIQSLPVRRFCFLETAGLLMYAPLLEPGIDFPGRAFLPHRFLTASLGSIHDASAAGLRVAEKRPTGQRKETRPSGDDINHGVQMKIINVKDYQSFSTEKMKKNNIFESPRFFCDVYCFEPGQEQKGHIHGEQDKVYLVLEGQGTFQVGQMKHVLGPGQGTMAPAGEEHGVKNDSGQRLKVLVFVAPNPTRG
jgi:quercetin dioxygenase-like cupin family protein